MGRLLKIIFFCSLFLNFSLKGISQNTTNQKVKLDFFLSKISDKYKVFFTYDPSVITDKSVDFDLYNVNDLQLIINRLRTKTNLHYDNIGNNYYVVYSDKDDKDLISVTINRNEKQLLNDSLSVTENNNKIIGKVVDKTNKPIYGASIIVKNTSIGTTTDIGGNFSLLLKEKATSNTIIVSHLSYAKRAITITKNKALIIVLREGELLDEIQLVGSRNAYRTTENTPSPLEVIDLDEVTDKSGQVEINHVLQYAIPSFNATQQSGADGADHIVPATLRGLGPDQTLVLINGKRRHQSSLINIYGTKGRGNTGTDINTIPASAIKKIEVLKDGASSQYGSDAIAGVINIILKDNVDSFTGNITYGFNNANARGNFKNPTNGIDGNTLKIAGNYGFNIFNRGKLNLTTEFLTKDNTRRPGADFRENYGNAALDEYSFFVNTEIPIKENINFYSFGGFSNRNSESYAFTRPANSPRNVISIYPNGFNPLITAAISDKSISTGVRIKFNKWNIDINNTFGSNNFEYLIKETLNATLLDNSPTSFDAGGHKLSQNTTSADFNRYFENFLNGVNIAFGTEYRIENYQIFDGEAASYESYDINGNIVDNNTDPDNFVYYNSEIRPGGSQGFPGYSVENRVNQTRRNLALYVDTEFDFSKKFMIGLSGRYEKYSDFGSTFNSKLTSRYEPFKNLNLRMSISSGFRAPSLAQIYYNLKFTNYISSIPSESLLVPNNSPITRDFGISSLIEEKAFNFNLGIAYKINEFSASIDSYFVDIKDRIILTGNFEASHLNSNVRDVQFFANGVDTKSFGIDVLLSWNKNIGESKFYTSLSGNINSMKIDAIKNRMLNQDTFFGVRDQYFLLASAPKHKFTLSLSHIYKKIETNLLMTKFSKIKLIDWQIIKPIQQEDPTAEFISNEDRFIKATDTYNSKITTDLNIGYLFSKSIKLKAGANNLFNIYPTQQQSEYTDGGGYWDATQMGTNGTFFYSRLTYKF